MKDMFTIQGNICGDRIRLGRAMHKPPLTQQDLASKMQLLGLDLSNTLISRIENGERHVIDIELRMIAQALGVSMEWLVGDTDKPGRIEDR